MTLKKDNEPKQAENKTQPALSLLCEGLPLNEDSPQKLPFLEFMKAVGEETYASDMPSVSALSLMQEMHEALPHLALIDELNSTPSIPVTATTSNIQAPVGIAVTGNIQAAAAAAVNIPAPAPAAPAAAAAPQGPTTLCILGTNVIVLRRTIDPYRIFVRYIFPRALKPKAQKYLDHTSLADQHPNLLMSLLAVKHRNGSVDVDTEFADAITLMAFISKFSKEHRLIVAMSVAQQLFMGLYYREAVHGQVHRHISPRYVLLQHNGCAKLDVFDAFERDDIENNQDYFLTLPYTAPECRANVDAFLKGDSRADVWSVGMLILAILQGKTYQPHQKAQRLGDTVALETSDDRKAYRLERAEIEDDDTRATLIQAIPDAGLRYLVGRCLVKEKAQRATPLEAYVFTILLGGAAADQPNPYNLQQHESIKLNDVSGKLQTLNHPWALDPNAFKFDAQHEIDNSKKDNQNDAPTGALLQSVPKTKKVLLNLASKTIGILLKDSTFPKQFFATFEPQRELLKALAKDIEREHRSWGDCRADRSMRAPVDQFMREFIRYRSINAWKGLSFSVTVARAIRAAERTKEDEAAAQKTVIVDDKVVAFTQMEKDIKSFILGDVAEDDIFDVSGQELKTRINDALQTQAISKLVLSNQGLNVRLDRLSLLLEGTQVHALVLDSNQIDTDQAIRLLSTLKNTAVQKISLRDNVIMLTPEVAAAISYFVAVDLSNNNAYSLQRQTPIGVFINSASPLVFTEAKLEKLILSNNSIGDDQVDCLLSSLAGTPLKTLDLSENLLTLNGVAKVLEKSKQTRIETLYLNRNKIELYERVTSVVHDFCNALGDCRIQKLHFAGNNLKYNDSFKAFASALNTNKHIQTLNLSDCHMDDESNGLVLRECQVSQLSLVNNGISFKIFGALTSISKTIKVLDLSGNLISYAQLPAVIHATRASNMHTLKFAQPRRDSAITLNECLETEAYQHKLSRAIIEWGSVYNVVDDTLNMYPKLKPIFTRKVNLLIYLLALCFVKQYKRAPEQSQHLLGFTPIFLILSFLLEENKNLLPMISNYKFTEHVQGQAKKAIDILENPKREQYLRGQYLRDRNALFHGQVFRPEVQNRSEITDGQARETRQMLRAMQEAKLTILKKEIETLRKKWDTELQPALSYDRRLLDILTKKVNAPGGFSNEVKLRYRESIRQFHDTTKTFSEEMRLALMRVDSSQSLIKAKCTRTESLSNLKQKISLFWKDIAEIDKAASNKDSQQDEGVENTQQTYSTAFFGNSTDALVFATQSEAKGFARPTITTAPS
jgi:serine/threonine protein kinase